VAGPGWPAGAGADPATSRARARAAGVAVALVCWALGCADKSEHAGDENDSGTASGACGPVERRDSDGRCRYALAVAVIRYALEQPSAEDQYVFGPDATPPVAASIGSTIYISAGTSFGFRGAPLATSWSVLDPAGDSVAVLPTDTSAQAEFSVTARGEYSIALEAHPVDDPSLSGQSELHLRVDPWRCALDGTSPPCAAADPVPGGSFSLGSVEGEGEGPAHAASVQGFALDRWEVTVGRFARFLDTYAGGAPAPGAGAHPQIEASGWRPEYDAALPLSRQQFELAFEDCGGTWYSDDPLRAARPINCVSWYEAFAFCIWDDGRLPTEAEWEYAAAGGSERRRYPWGNPEPTSDQAVFGCRFESSPACSEADLPPVGNAPRGAGRFGQQDLAGSLWEWTLDQYAPYGTQACTDCAVLDGGEGRVFRGGGYRSDDVAELRTTHRLGFLAEQRDVTRGFRCARATPR
jgi:formylglycine-generating enzyme